MLIQYLFLLIGILNFNVVCAISIVKGPPSEIQNLAMYDELSENYLQVFCANSLDLENSCIIVQEFVRLKGTDAYVAGQFLFNGTDVQAKDWNWLLVYAADKIPVKTEGILEARLMLKIERHPSFDWASSVISFDPAWEKEHNDLGCLKIYHPMNKDKRVVIRTSCNSFLFAPFKMYDKRNVHTDE